MFYVVLKNNAICWKKTLAISAYLGAISMQTKIKLFKAIKGVLNCCKLQVIFKSQNKICDNVIT